MKILCIHGYKSCKQNSAYNALTDCGYDVVSSQIDYDNISPKIIRNNLYEMYLKNSCNAVVGTSVGGFFAAQICAKESCPAVFINPCLLPFVYLPRLGYKYEDGIRQFSEMFSAVADVDKRLVSTIIGAKDEIIDTQEYTKAMFGNSRYIVVPDGKHSGSTLPLKEIFNKYGKSFFNATV